MDKLSEVEDNLKDYLNNNADIQKIKGSPRQYFGLGTILGASPPNGPGHGSIGGSTG